MEVLTKAMPNAEAAKEGARPPGMNAHRVRNTWIATRKLEDLLGPVKPEFLAAAEKARSEGAEPAPNSAETPADPEP